MHGSKRTGLIVGSTLAAVMSLSGVALAEGNDGAKKDPATQQKKTNSDHTMMHGDASSDPAVVGSVDQIKELQRELASRGFYQGNIDGVAGAKTRAALRNFQVQQGIAINGGLNAQTRDSLGLEWDRQPVKGTDTPQPERMRGEEQTQVGTDNTAVRVNLAALNAEQTKEIQQKLQQLGFYQGTVDGKFGAGTRAALTRYFQRQAQLASQGMVDDSAISVFGIQAGDVKRVSGD